MNTKGLMEEYNC